ncbi:MAG: lipoyl(octanoyl) transferase LipB [Bacteroidales bacterium]|nr:lipoyl(octanoyl) transferase LipB [Bacteroidales bacterium]
MKTIQSKNLQVQFKDLGLIQYKQAWDEQEMLFDRVVAVKEANRTNPVPELTPNFLLFCSHPHVYTLGKSGNESNLLINPDFLASKGAELYRINRGGDITYHGPGQLVGYPILDLVNFGVSIKSYINILEEVIIRSLRYYGITGTRADGATGVWLDTDKPARARKICAIGVRTSHWVSMHGFAFNVNTNLDYFNYIIPCGIQGKGVTSLQKELGREVDITEVQALLKREFQQVFGMELI